MSEISGRERAIKDFFGVTETDELGPPLNKQDQYDLPDGFSDWNEWHAILTSCILAQVACETVHDCEPHPFLPPGTKENVLESIARKASLGEIDSEDWKHLFMLLQKDFKIDPTLGPIIGSTIQTSEAIKFFERIKRMSAKNEDGLVPYSRDELIARFWITPESLLGQWPGLCATDLDSASQIVAGMEGVSAESASDKSNFRRTLKRLDLQQCKRKLWRVERWIGSLPTVGCRGK